MTGIKFEQLVLDAFDQLAPFYTSENSNAEKKQISSQLSGDYLAIKAQIGSQVTNETQTKNIRILPPQLTAQSLARFMGEAKACWVLEDFHKIDESERQKLSQVMKVFMDTSIDYPELKIVAIGATDTARQVVEYDPEMKNRVAEIYVPLMDDTEIEQIITTGCKLLKIELANNLVKGISKYANGLASVCHHLCLNLCTTQNIYKTLEETKLLDEHMLKEALKVYLDEVSDTLKKVFDMAFKQTKVKKFDNAKLIIKALSTFSQEGALRAEINQKIIKANPKYPQGNLTLFLNKLSNESGTSLLRQDTTSGRYSFRDPVYRAFALAYFENEPKKSFGSSPQIDAIWSSFQAQNFKALTDEFLLQLVQNNTKHL